MQEPGAEYEIRKYGYIDALRGFAIIGVIMVHVGQWIPPRLVPNWCHRKGWKVWGAAIFCCKCIYANDVIGVASK